MRRFSQRNSLVTLSDINITPLQDLAFVLLIIFVITTPMLTQSVDLQLPSGGRPDKKQLGKNDVRTVEISPNGNYRLNTRAVKIDQLEQELVKAFKSNPNLVVYVRADKIVPFEHVAAVLDCCQRNNITRFSVRTGIEKRK
jgi:biopolymer transport protein ExbD